MTGLAFWRRARGVGERRAAIGRALDDLAAAEAPSREEALIRLVEALRPRHRSDEGEARANLGVLTLLVAEDERRCRALRAAVVDCLEAKRSVHLFTDAGVLSGEGFRVGLTRRLAYAVLPDVYDPTSLRDFVGRLFARARDHEWVSGIPEESWLELIAVLELDGLEAERRERLAGQLLEAVQVLSYRIAAMGLEHELVRNYPAIERYDSPFLAQSEEVRQLIREHRAALAERRAPRDDAKHLEVLLAQCLEIVAKVRREAERSGASISLTALILRLQESIGRMRTILDLLEPRAGSGSDARHVRVFTGLVRSVSRDKSLAVHWARHMELLALRVTGNAGRAGERYITQTRGEYRAMFRSAAGAGFVIAFMALIKVALMNTPSAPFVEAALYSLNYGLGFVLIYVVHFTIATKQPAMTASYIAATLASGRRVARMEGLADLVLRTVRSQFIAVMGNLSVVLPMSALLALAFRVRTGAHFATVDQAEYLLHDLSPIDSPALFHAAIAGVCLFASGLIAGYYDNRAVYNEHRARIAQLPVLRRWLGARRAEELGLYIENHLGGITGNFLLGIMLGSMATVGFVLGLPLDIRHVTFSSAYLGIALVGLDAQIGWYVLALSALGVAAIGLINLAVSFSLALWVAMRSQRVTFLETPALLRILAARVRRNPSSLFIPPREKLGGETPRAT